MSLEELNYQVYGCRKCRLWQGAKHGVPGEGPSNAKVMLIGQNPGRTEDETGRPFCGITGRYLNQVLLSQGIKREELFITGIVKHASPKNRKPYPDEVAACLPYLLAQIDIIKPKLILLLGETAKATPRIPGIEFMEAVHPSAAKRFPKMRTKFEEKIAVLAEKIKSLK